MTIPTDIVQRFQQLIISAQAGTLCLLEVSAHTGEPAYVLATAAEGGMFPWGELLGENAAKTSFAGPLPGAQIITCVAPDLIPKGDLTQDEVDSMLLPFFGGAGGDGVTGD